MTLRIFTVCALVLLAGCQRESGAPNQGPKLALHSQAPVAVQRGPTLEQQTAGMVEAATQGKSQTPVALKFDLKQRPVQGHPLEIDLALLPGEAAGPATVQVSAPEGMQLSPDAAELEFPSVEPAQVYRRSIKLSPTAEGVFLLTLTVNLQHDQLMDTRVFSVPVIVGAGAASPAGAAGSTSAAAPAASGGSPHSRTSPPG
ncbi:MAG TPA: hypothetical protein VHY75_10625 [Steroidobacteraceae bacterium]|nr:hypothetical protein [Steroidobacteraceae bacterium]